MTTSGAARPPAVPPPVAGARGRTAGPCILAIVALAPAALRAGLVLPGNRIGVTRHSDAPAARPVEVLDAVEQAAA